MALQLLKRPYTMQGSGPDFPRILRNGGSESRSSLRNPMVEISDVMTRLRLDPTSAHANIIKESVSKYEKGRNPAGETSYRYVVNKSFRPPIIDPKYYESLSRMPVKMSSITAGPIVSDLYKKQVTVVAVAPKMTIDRVAPKANGTATRAASSRQDNPNLILSMKPKTSVQAVPSMPIHIQQDVSMQLDPKISTSVNSGIHNPNVHSDFSRDVTNMRTPQHIAIKSNVQDIYQPGVPENQLPNLTPKVSTAGWNNPNYFYVDGDLCDSVGATPIHLSNRVKTSAAANPNYQLVDAPKSTPINPETFLANKVRTAASAKPTYQLVDAAPVLERVRTVDRVHVSQRANPSQNIEAGDRHHEFNRLHPTIASAGHYDPRAAIPTIQEHPTYGRAHNGGHSVITGSNTAAESGFNGGGGYEGFQVGSSQHAPDQGWGVGLVDRPQGGLPTVGLRNAVRANPLRVGRDSIPLQGMDDGTRLTGVDGGSKFVRW